MTETPGTTLARLDRSAFGIVFGAITVLAILLAAGAHPGPPFEMAAALFGSVLAITLAQALAELLAHALDTGEGITRSAWGKAWRHSGPTLAVANLPARLFCAAGLDWIGPHRALVLSQGLCVALPGARVGRVLDGKAGPAVLGAVFAGGVGLALAILKYVIH